VTDEAYDPHAAVERWTRLWHERGTFEAHGLTGEPADRPRSYVVGMYPYPSGDLHMGHAEAYSISDAIARYARLRGADVLNPIGWDSFGLPAENAALNRGLDPRQWTYANIATQAESFRRLGVAFDWRTRLHTSDPEYYRWNQWLFLRLHAAGLAYRREAAVNWCPKDQTVLANEQVSAGACERCGTRVRQRRLTQWFFRITAYAQRLLDDMAQLAGRWPPEILTMQRNWIGRSSGAHIDFAVDGRTDPIRVFTTRPDTLFGATFLVVAVDSPLADAVCGPDQRAAFEAYRQRTADVTENERLATDRPKEGVPLGRSAVNPISGERVPIYAADYILAHYGTGATMAVPAHDERDRDFARAHDLPVRVVVDEDGRLINSGTFDGMAVTEGAAAIAGRLRAIGAGGPAVTYRLRDWLISRQRYWGTPIPMVHCEVCGVVPVPEDQLPVLLPERGYQLRPAGARSRLDRAEDWVNVDCPACRRPARRDTDTMDTFVDSSWYFLRYPNPRYADGPFDPAGVARWLPVDEYVGGRDHATGHLMYARFVTKALCDLGLVTFTEPFTRLINQGQVIMHGRAMSKSLGNLVDLREQIDRYGPDAVRVTMVFAGPPEDDIDWANVTPTGAVKWLARVWRLTGDLPDRPSGQPDLGLRRTVHSLIAATTAAMDGRRLNVAIARLMELTNVLRRAIDAGRGAGGADPAVREGTEALVRMVSCFAPFTAEEGWQRLGHPPSVSDGGWPTADPGLLVRETVTCVVQIDGKVRDRLDVPADIGEDDLRALALDAHAVRAGLGGSAIERVIVRPPHIVSIVSVRSG
jgi:leucyl-tRNA synthetase